MDFMKNISEIIDKRIQKSLADTQKTVCCTAKSSENSSGFVSVSISDKSISVINKSGEAISNGDTVYISYKNNISKGYISRRIGAYKANGQLSLTQAEFDALEADGNLIEGWVYYVYE